MRYYLLLVIGFSALSLMSCKESKYINKGNVVYEYVDNQSKRAKYITTDSTFDYMVALKLKTPLKEVKFEEKSDHLVIDKKRKNATIGDTLIVKRFTNADNRLLAYEGKLFTLHGVSERQKDSANAFANNKSFKYGEWKFALQTLTVPLKIRPRLGNDTTYPSQVETGVNIGFAPVIRRTWSTYHPTRPVMGKATSSWSMSAGPLFSIGATDLKKSTATNPGNAPGIPSDRKSAIFSYGGFLIFGFNNINVGYAVGGDAVLGKGSKYWKYQGVYWHGVIVALDIIK